MHYISKASLGPYAWQHRPAKRVKSSAVEPRDLKLQELAYQHLPVAADHSLRQKPTSTQCPWKDSYLEHPDLRNLVRSEDVFLKIERDSALSLVLPKPGATAGKVLDHCIQTFEQLVSKHKPLTFKFGITHDAAVRWRNSKFGYIHAKGDVFDHMVVIYAASNPHGPAFLEAALIDRFSSYLSCFSCIMVVKCYKSLFCFFR